MHGLQVEFEDAPSGSDASVVTTASKASLDKAAQLMAVKDSDSLAGKLVTRVRELRGGETVTSNNTPSESQDLRDALAKVRYAAMLRSRVSLVDAETPPRSSRGSSHSLSSSTGSSPWPTWRLMREGTAARRSLATSACSISCVLRTATARARALFHERCPLSLSQFGFEDMKVNGFEQLFINTTNEQLQRLFNDIIFKQEAAEYERESIEWDRTAFPDNMPCIELLSKKPHGLLRVLDNECLRGMAASDGDKLVSKFNKQHGSHANYDVCGPASVFRRKVRFLEVVGGGEAGGRTPNTPQRAKVTSGAHESCARIGWEAHRGERLPHSPLCRPCHLHGYGFHR